MQIQKIEPAVEHDRGTNRLLARFDVKITDDILLRNMMLKRKPDGTLRVFAPHWHGQHVISMAPELAARVTAAADAALKGLTPDDTPAE